MNFTRIGRRNRGRTGAALLVIVGLIAVIWYMVAANTTHTTTITVCGKERVAVKNSGEYRIYAAEGTYVMADSLFGTVRYDTADAYAKVKPKTTYDVVYKGWRIPFFSSFPNLLELKESATQHPEACANFG